MCILVCVRVRVWYLIPQCRSYPGCSLGSWGARGVPVVGTERKHGWYSSHWTPASPPSYHNQSSSGLNRQREKQIIDTGAHTAQSCSLASPAKRMTSVGCLSLFCVCVWVLPSTSQPRKIRTAVRYNSGIIKKPLRCIVCMTYHKLK